MRIIWSSTSEKLPWLTEDRGSEGERGRVCAAELLTTLQQAETRLTGASGALEAGLREEAASGGQGKSSGGEQA